MHSLETSLGFLLNRAGVAVGNAFSQELKMSGMTLAMWRVLAALHDTGHQSLGGLAEFISVEISTLSRQVATLSGRGLIVNQPSGKNWRSVDLSLTPAGQAVVQRLLPSVERHERAALDGIDRDDIDVLKRLLEKVYRNLRALDVIAPVLQDNEPA
ncbi:MarR family winged helix-turn-helix transcriptional regulator [Sphingomonas sp.]|uniref:MarR family winged helix-turn-helix transcriptional regulator n=1 Tax=Sphingomonas sp. TaxID=28214 RepID=UPI0035BBDD39